MTIDWTTLNAKLPTEKSSNENDDHTEQRRQIFTQYFDMNNNGYCSLAECDKGLTELLNDTSVNISKPVILRAFTSAKTVAQEKGVHSNSSSSSSSGDYIEFSELRYFLLYIKEYIQLWELFETIDNDNDRRISYDEFVNNTLPKLQSNEYYSRIFPTTTTTESVFQSIDTNNGGFILFNELTQYIINKRMMTIEE